MRLVVLLSMLALGAPAPNAGAEEVDVVPRLNSEIRGRVINLDTGRPFQYAIVVLGGTRLTAGTAEDGTFVIRDVPAGLYTLRVTALGFKPFELTEIVTAWSETLNIPLPLVLEKKKCPCNKKRHTYSYADYVSAERLLTGTLRPRLEPKPELLPLPRGSRVIAEEWIDPWSYAPLWQRRRYLSAEELESRDPENSRLERASVTWTEAWRRRIE